MLIYGSVTRLVSLAFRQNSNDVVLTPDGGTTYTATRTLTLPPGDSNAELIGAASTQTLTNKTLSGASNTVSNISLTASVTGTLPEANGGTGQTSLTGLTTSLDVFTSVAQGVVPASGGGTANFLRADGTWTAAGTGTVTSVSVTTANGVSGSVATSTTTPAITLTLGAITPTSVASTGTVSGTNLTSGGHASQDLALAGGTMSGNIAMGANKVTGLAAPTTNGDALRYDQLGTALGIATLDAGGKIPAAQLPNSVMDYLGTWAASTNTPTLADGTGSAGDVYISSDAGTVNFGSGNIIFAAGDWVVYSGAIWEKSVNSNAVASVNGSTGAVTVNAINQLTGDVTATAASGSQSKATTVAAIAGTTVSGTTGTVNVVFSASPTVTGTLSAAAISASGTVTGSNLSGTNTGDMRTSKSDWTNANGTTKVVTHSWGLAEPRDILVQIWDENSQQILVDTITAATNTVTLVSSQAPAATWRVSILALS